MKRFALFTSGLGILVAGIVRRTAMATAAGRTADIAAGIDPLVEDSLLFATLPGRCALPQITAHSLARSRGRFSFKPAGRIAIAADPE